MDHKMTFLSLWLLGSLVVSPLMAQDQSHEEHGSHNHGQAVLTFVLEGNEAELAFATPTANIVGFEHQTQNDVERQLVQKMIADFTLANWFSFDAAANCTVTGTDISSDLTADRPTKPLHADLNANYTLVCQNPAQIRHLTLQLANIATAVKQVSVQWIVNGEQGAALWSTDADKISLSGVH